MNPNICSRQVMTAQVSSNITLSFVEKQLRNQPEPVNSSEIILPELFHFDDMQMIIMSYTTRTLFQVSRDFLETLGTSVDEHLAQMAPKALEVYSSDC